MVNNMKKKLLILFLLVVALVSCDNSVTNDYGSIPEVKSAEKTSPNDEEALLRLQTSIHTYNLAQKNALHLIKSKHSSKGFWKRLWQCVATAFADVVGGAVGGCPGAVLSSGLVGGYSFGGNVDYSIVFGISNGGETRRMPVAANASTDSVNIGMIHNEILGSIFKDSVNFTSFVAMDEEQKSSYLLNELSQTYSNMGKASDFQVDKYYYISLADTINSTLARSESFDDFYYKLKETHIVNESILNVLKEFMDGLDETDSPQSVEEYITAMLKFVNQSSLSESYKQSFKDAFFIGAASDEFWNRDIPLEFSTVE